MSEYTPHRYRNKLPVTISLTPTIGTGIYTTADVVGGLLTFAGAADKKTGSGTIKAAILIDNDSEEDTYELHLYNQTFTSADDHDAVTVTDADLKKYVGRIDFTAANYVAFATNSVDHMDVDLPFTLPIGGTSLFGNLVVRGGPTYTATTDITVKLVIVQD